jgi:hypothetical protein
MDRATPDMRHRWALPGQRAPPSTPRDAARRRAIVGHDTLYRFAVDRWRNTMSVTSSDGSWSLRRSL